jgi:hypothetical protein
VMLKATPREPFCGPAYVLNGQPHEKFHFVWCPGFPDVLPGRAGRRAMERGQVGRLCSVHAAEPEPEQSKGQAGPLQVVDAQATEGDGAGHTLPTL